MDKRILISFFLLQIACQADSDRILIKVNNFSTSSNSKQANKKNPVKLSENDKDSLYFSLLNGIIDDSVAGRFPEGIDPSEQLVYRKETISPIEFDQLEKTDDVSKSLLESFKGANRDPETLAERYGIPAAVQAYSGSRDLVKFYETVKQKDPYTKAVIGFSSPGIDETYSEALIYVEYYKPGKELKKYYYRMKLEQPKNSIKTGAASTDDRNFSNVSGYKVIPIN